MTLISCSLKLLVCCDILWGSNLVTLSRRSESRGMVGGRDWVLLSKRWWRYTFVDVERWTGLILTRCLDRALSSKYT